MNKNTVFAFILILGTVYFFNSPFYYEKVLRRPYPRRQEQVREQRKRDVLANDTLSQELLLAQERGEPLESRSSTRDSADVAGVQSQGVEPTYEMIETGDTIRVETDNIICTIDELGAVVLSIKMKQYNYNPIMNSSKPDSLIELVPPGERTANLVIDNTRFDEKRFRLLERNDDVFRTDDDPIRLVFRHEKENGHYIDKIYTFHKGGYLFDLAIVSPFIRGRKVQVGWQSGIRESEETATGGRQMQDVKRAHTYDGREVQHITRKRVGLEENTGFFWWTGVSSKYFLVALIPQEKGDADIGIEAFVYDGEGKNARYDYRISHSAQVDDEEQHYRLFTGPMQLAELGRADVKLNKVLYGGWRWFLRADIWFPALCEMVLRVLIALQNIVKDYGVAIVLLTVMVKLVTYPMTQSSTKSMARMKDIQPKVNNIRNRYKGNAQKMNQEIMALYKKEGINPMNPGCLPMFLQMPILFSLFIVLRKAIELRGAGTVLLPWIRDLSQAEALPGITPMFQGMFPNGLPMYGSTVGLMPIVMAVLTFYQNKATMKDPNQKAMIYIMPVFMLVLFNSFPSGLVLYWTLSSGLGLAQQYLTSRTSKDGQQNKDGQQKQKR